MKKNLKRLSLAVMLSAVGIVIPMIMPRIQFGDAASYTLASHVAIFIAMFVGPDVAIMVGSATTFGFFLSAPIVIAARAFSHLFWAVPGAWLLKPLKQKMKKWPYAMLINVMIGLVHAALESIVVLIFYSSRLSDAKFVFSTILIPIGIGGFVHSLIDFQISIFIYHRLEDQLYIFE